MLARINKIKEFQKVMPAKKNQIGDETKQKWCEIRDQLTSALKKAEEDLLELMNASENIVNADRQDCVYAIAQDPWVGINDCQRPYDWRKYPSLFRKEVFKKESDAISALIKEVSLEVSRNRITAHDDFDLEFGDNAVKIVWKQKAVGCGEGDAKVAYLRIEKIEVPARYKVVEDRTMIADMADFLNKDIRFRFWDCHEWIRQFCHSMCAYRNGAVSQYSLEDLKANCDWWKFIGVTYDGDYSFEQLDVPKLVDGCPWFMDHPECSQIHLGPKDWVLLLNRHPKFADRCKVWKEFSDEDWNGLIERHPQLVKYKNIGSGEGI